MSSGSTSRQDTVTCPQGKSTPIYKPRANRPRQSDTRIARFKDPALPAAEALRSHRHPRHPHQSPRGPPPRSACGVTDPAERNHLERVQPRIERLLALIAHRYKGRKSRYLGARKSTFQALWTAVLVNLHPIAAALRAETA